MGRIKRPDRTFIYISPLKDCQNQEAEELASLVERFMIESAELLIDFTQCRVKQIYEATDKFMKGKIK